MKICKCGQHPFCWHKDALCSMTALMVLTVPLFDLCLQVHGGGCQLGCYIFSGWIALSEKCDPAQHAERLGAAWPLVSTAGGRAGR